jgi:hypothetical protein
MTKLQDMIDTLQKGVTGAISSVSSQLASNKAAWSDWQGGAVGAARAVQREVDAVSFGHSPGGLKEIPLQLVRSRSAAAAFASDFTKQMQTAQTAVDRISAVKAPRAQLTLVPKLSPEAISHGLSSSGKGTPAVLNIHMDKRRVSRSLVTVIPGTVKDFKLA